MKRLLSAVAAAAVLVSTVPSALAVSDITGHWAAPYLTEMHELGIINPSSSTGEYTPDTPIMRWEFMRYINRAFGFTEKASINYSDVSPSDSYYETVQIAVEYGYINGSARQDRPGGTLTREQAATILGRLHKYTPDADLSALDVFRPGTLSDTAAPMEPKRSSEAILTAIPTAPSFPRVRSSAARSPRSCTISSARRCKPPVRPIPARISHPTGKT